MSAVGTIVSAGYGFICGAYMPISNFGKGLQKGLSYVPVSYTHLDLDYKKTGNIYVFGDGKTNLTIQSTNGDLMIR